MGSLMAGWGTRTIDPKSASLKRNHSLTKEEIDAFWKSKKDTEEDKHIRAISNLQKSIQPGKYDDTVNNLEQLIKKNGWWTKSNWAFLNEPPPVMEVASNKYASQFHVTNMGSSETNPGNGISA